MSSSVQSMFNNIAELHGQDESPWPKISPEFDAQMIKAIETGVFEDPRTGKKKTLFQPQADGALVPILDIRTVPLNELKDMQGRPVVQGKRYIFRTANESEGRGLDYEDNNKRKVVNNMKWHGGLYMKILKRYNHTDALFMLEYPGGGNWLTGNHPSKDDVTLTGSNSTSAWMFQSMGNDRNGHPCYAVWSEKWGATEYDYGFWMPEYGVSRAGYDNDYEWRVYSGGSGAPYGFFSVKFQRMDYNE